MGVDTADNQLSSNPDCKLMELGHAQNEPLGHFGRPRLVRLHSFVDQKKKGPGIEIRAARSQLLSDFSVTAEVWDAKANKDLHSQTLHPLSKFAATCTFHRSSKLVDPAIKVMLAIQGQFPVFESSQL